MIAEPDYMLNLVFDAATHTYRYAGNLVPHITEIVPSDYSHVNPRVLERARVRGHRVHHLTELFDKKLPIDWALVAAWQIEGFLNSWLNCCHDYEIEFEPEDVERKLFHPIAGFAGTGDRPRAWIKPPNQKRRLATIELKTIAKMDENVELQVGGQRYAENHRARALGIPEIDEGWGIQLKGDGTYGKPCHYTSKRPTIVFLSYLDCLKWEIQHGKRQLAIQGQRNGAGTNASQNSTHRRR